MTNTLTRQYPFRLDKMFIINDSIFIQTVWSIAKQFLTEVQQQKMNFMRTGYAKELLKIYAAHHLEKEFGGTRSEITSFYPFPLLSGPFKPYSTGPNPKAVPNCHHAIGPMTVEGRLWEGSDRPPIEWGPKAYEVFQTCGLTPPPSVLPPPMLEEEKKPAQPEPKVAVIPATIVEEVKEPSPRPEQRVEVVELVTSPSPPFAGAVSVELVTLPSSEFTYSNVSPRPSGELAAAPVPPAGSPPMEYTKGPVPRRVTEEEVPEPSTDSSSEATPPQKLPQTTAPAAPLPPKPSAAVEAEQRAAPAPQAPPAPATIAAAETAETRPPVPVPQRMPWWKTITRCKCLSPDNDAVRKTRST